MPMYWNIPFDQRYRFLKPPSIGVPVDIFPYSKHEVEQMLRERWGMVLPALRDGIVLGENNGAWSGIAALASRPEDT